MDKSEQMRLLEVEAKQLLEDVCGPDTNLVMGEGNLDSDIMLIGEAPGADEDRSGRPFVGRAGKLLNEELQRTGIMRDDIYITNVVKCRPTTMEDGRKKNRAPSVAEIKAWLDLLMREIDLVSPKVIVCLGATAASTLLGRSVGMKTERGQWFDGPKGTRLTLTYHPSYILRTMNYGRETLMQFRQDLDAVSTLAGERARRQG